MTLRLGLAARITLIVGIALMAAWIGAITLYYRSQDLDGDNSRPSPRQIAALAALVERTPREERPLVLAAVNSGVLSAKLEQGDGLVIMPRATRPASEAVRQAYLAELGDRHVAITLPAASAAQWPFPRVVATAADPLRFRIALNTGEMLVVETKSSLIVSRLGLPVGFGAGLIGTLIALLALITMHRETRPIARLASALDTMDLAGNPVLLPQSRTSAPEIRALITAFNRLQARLSQLLRARMAMLGGISHDVRTFATRLRLRVDQIPEGPQRDRAIEDIADMIRLLDDALLASRAGAGELAEELVEFDQIVRLEVEDRQVAGSAIDLRISRSAAGISILGDRLALRRIVSNLVDNALTYGHAAHLVVEADAQTITLTVDDEGSGVPPDLREILLEPFVRLENSRSRRTGGAGLGLAVVRSLVEGHGGTIAIADAPGGGARFTLSLPVFQPQDPGG